MGGGCPFQAKAAEGGFTAYEERIDAKKVRARSQSFFDHFSQATLFYNSQSEAEKNHITNALRFELGKVEIVEIRQRMIGLLSQVDKTLAQNVASALGLKVPAQPEQPINRSIPADGNPARFQPKAVNQGLDRSAALSMAGTPKDTIKTRKIAILAADGVDGGAIEEMKKALAKEGATAEVIAPHLGEIRTVGGASGGAKGAAAVKGAAGTASIAVDKSLLTVSSVLYDAVYLPGGAASIRALKEEADAIHFINQAYKHCKAIAVDPEAAELIGKSNIGELLREQGALPGLVFSPGKGGVAGAFIKAIAQHRFWERETMVKVSA
jgi:catalase